MEFREKFLKLRRQRGLTQMELAKELEVSRKTIQFYESGDRYPKRSTMTKICAFFHVSLEYLISNEDAFLMDAQEFGGVNGRLTADQLIHQATALFAGGELCEDDKDKVMKALQDTYWEAKEINKQMLPKRRPQKKKTDE